MGPEAVLVVQKQLQQPERMDLISAKLLFSPTKDLIGGSPHIEQAGTGPSRRHI